MTGLGEICRQAQLLPTVTALPSSVYINIQECHVWTWQQATFLKLLFSTRHDLFYALSAYLSLCHCTSIYSTFVSISSFLYAVNNKFSILDDSPGLV